MMTDPAASDTEEAIAVTEHVVETISLDAAYERAIRVLRAGFLIAATLLVIGLILFAVRGESIPESVDPLPEIPAAVLDGKSAAFLDLGLIALMLTPVFTVLSVAVSFLQAGDRRYAGISFVTLAVLGVSIGLSLFR